MVSINPRVAIAALLLCFALPFFTAEVLHAQERFEQLSLGSGSNTILLKGPASGDGTFTFPSGTTSSTNMLTSDAGQNIYGMLTLGKNGASGTPGTLVLLDGLNPGASGSVAFGTMGFSMNSSLTLNGTLYGGSSATSVLTLQGSSNSAPTNSYVRIQGEGMPVDFNGSDGIYMGKASDYGIELVQSGGSPHIDFSSQAGDYDARLYLRNSVEFAIATPEIYLDNTSPTIRVASTFDATGYPLYIFGSQVAGVSDHTGGNITISGGAGSGSGSAGTLRLNTLFGGGPVEIGTGNGTIKVGGGAAFHGILSATATLDFPSTAAHSVSDLPVTVNGVSTNDVVYIGLPDSPEIGIFTGFVSGGSTVTVRYSNFTAGAVDPAAATYRVTVIHY